jgi:Trk K+ transport system NAD-binding subunit
VNSGHREATNPHMPRSRVLVVGSGHLAYRIRKLLTAREHEVVHLRHEVFQTDGAEATAQERVAGALAEHGLATIDTVYLVDDRDERNLEMLVLLISLDRYLPIVASLFNESIAPHLQAAHPNVQALNPAKIAAPTFVRALDTPVDRTLVYVPARAVEEPAARRADRLIASLVGAFASLVALAIGFFHVAEQLSWLDAAYFVVVTVATVGYGDISLLRSGTASKVAAIVLIVGSTFFVWLIFSLTVDRIIKRRVQIALGRKRYTRKGHVILCGLGRLGYFVADGLLRRGEKVLIIEANEASPAIEYFRSRGADVYIGDARLPRVLQDAGVARARALYSVINGDLANLEIARNARSFRPDLRLILRIFDESMSRSVKENLDLQLSFSMSAIADETFLNALQPRSTLTTRR